MAGGRLADDPRLNTYTQQVWDQAEAVSFSDVRAMTVDDLRHALYWLACGKNSSADINTTSDYDRLKAFMSLCLNDADLKSAVVLSKPARTTTGELRRVYDMVRCLGLYHDDPDAYVGRLLSDRFGGVAIDDLDDQALHQLLMTLGNRINGKHGLRARAGHSIHYMLTACKLPCRCAACRKKSA
jgi:hypothetical protein